MRYFSQTMTYGSGNGLFVAPPQSINANPEKTWVDSISLCPDRDWQLLPHIIKEIVSSRVSSLLFWGCPATVFFAVVAVIINAVYCCVSLPVFFDMRQIRLVHIVAKLSKRVPFTSYSTTTVRFVGVVLRKVTSVFEVQEEIVKRSISHAMVVAHKTKIASRLRRLAILITSRNLVDGYIIPRSVVASN